ncbi:MAG: ferrous iron transport protein A [Clostridiales bacterium]|nr:ferrous iron transport protein A [Clostridiales bacterium]
MPLSMARVGDENSVKRVGGKPETRQFLENLGFVPGSLVTLITQISGNVIVSIRDSRVAISREMASKIQV